jgi:CheY-like chemotaxis protein
VNEGRHQITLNGQRQLANRPTIYTILLVDDNALISTSTEYLLEDLGHDVIEANSGEDALDVLKKGQKVDLLITDYSMPKMTGTQLVALRVS